MSWDRLWDRVYPNPIVLYFAAWFASGVLFARLRGKPRLIVLTLIGISLQVYLRREGIIAFELFSVAVYAYGWFVCRPVAHSQGVATPAEGEADRPSHAEDNQSRRWTWCCYGMFALIAAAAAGRIWFGEPAGQAPSPRWSAVLLMDFFQLLVLVTFLYEIGSGMEELPPPSRYLLWVHLPPIGTIIRLSDMTGQLDTLARPLAWNGVAWWGKWMLLCEGVLKCTGAVALALVEPTEFLPTVPIAFKLAAVFIIAPWQFYLLSAGMNDVQRAIGATWNLAVPVAYDWPFAKTNISRFWLSWNIPMTSVYRDYLFFARWGMQRPNVYLNCLIVFVAMGVWHAFNWYWLLFGIYHAIGFCVFLAYQQWQRSRAVEPTAPSRLRLFGCWLITYLFVCLGWYVPSKLVVYFGLGSET